MTAIIVVAAAAASVKHVSTVCLDLSCQQMVQLFVRSSDLRKNSSSDANPDLFVFLALQAVTGTARVGIVVDDTQPP